MSNVVGMVFVCYNLMRKAEESIDADHKMLANVPDMVFYNNSILVQKLPSTNCAANLFDQWVLDKPTPRLIKCEWSHLCKYGM